MRGSSPKNATDAPSVIGAPGASEAAIAWPAAVRRAAWLEGLYWGAPRVALADAPPPTEVARPPLASSTYPEAAEVQGIPLTATLVYELDRLVRIELTGALDGLALVALGAGEAARDDLGHYRLLIGQTRIAIDALDGLIALEPDEDP